jgi:hypothetical protein
MSAHSIIVWNVMRLFGSGGSPIEHALSDGDAAAVADEADVAEKIATIAAAVDAMARITGPPLLVGLVEIETNRLAQSIADAVQSAPLATVDDMGSDQAGFALDGLDISLLVNRDLVASLPLVRSHVIDRTFNTRDILEVDALLRNGTAMSVLVNHWPSRMVSEAAGLRVAAAHYLGRLVAEKTRYSLSEMLDAERRLIDLPTADEMLARARHPVVAMGDFNDEVFNEAIEILGSTSDLAAARDDLSVRGRRKKQRFAPTRGHGHTCTTRCGTTSGAAARTTARLAGAPMTRSC